MNICVPLAGQEIGDLRIAERVLRSPKGFGITSPEWGNSQEPPRFNRCDETTGRAILGGKKRRGEETWAGR